MKNLLTMNIVLFLTTVLMGCIDLSTDDLNTGQTTDSTIPAINSSSNTTAGQATESNYLQSLVSRSDLIFYGTLKGISYEISIEEIPYTFVTYDIHKIISGNYKGESLTLRFVGGDFPDGRSLHASNSPDVKIGEKSILVVQKGLDTGCDFVDCEHGRFVVEDGQIVTAKGSALVINNHGGVEYISHVARKSGEYKGRLDAMSLDRFVQHIQKLDTKFFGQGKGQRDTVTDIDRHEPFHATKGLTNAESAPSLSQNDSKGTPDSQDSQGSPYDQWEVEQLRQNGGNPVLSQAYHGDTQ